VAIQCGLLFMKNEMEQFSELFEALPSQNSHLWAWKMENIFFITK